MSENNKRDVKGAVSTAFKEDVLGSNEWKSSKLGYLTGASPIVKAGYISAKTIVAPGKFAIDGAKKLFARDKVAKLETTSKDPEERFKVAQRSYRRSEADLANMTIASARMAYTYVLILIALTAFAVYSMPPIEQASNIFLSYAFPWVAHIFVVPLLMRSAFYNWQLRDRALYSLKDFLSRPGEWLPPISSTTAKAFSWSVIGAMGLLLIPDAAFAQDANSAIAFLNEQPASDIFMRTLGMMAGGVGPIPQVIGEENPWIVPLGNAFGVFNASLMALAAAMVSWQTVAGMVATAQEGQVLGQRWHTMWAPVRVTAGIATLVPFSSGFAAIQIAVLQVVVWGSALANQVWYGYVETFANSAYLTGVETQDQQSQTAEAIFGLSRNDEARGMVMGIIESQACLVGLEHIANRQIRNYDAKTGSEIGTIDGLQDSDLEGVFGDSVLYRNDFSRAGMDLESVQGSGDGRLAVSELGSYHPDVEVGVDGFWGFKQIDRADSELVNLKSADVIARWNFGGICGTSFVNVGKTGVIREYLDSLGEASDGDLQTAYNAALTSANTVAQRIDSEVLPFTAIVAEQLAKTNLAPEQYGDSLDATLAELRDLDGQYVDLIGQAYVNIVDIMQDARGDVREGIYSLIDTTEEEQMVKLATDLGWASSGAFYVHLSRTNAANLKVGMISLESSPSVWLQWKNDGWNGLSNDTEEIIFGQNGLRTAVVDYTSNVIESFSDAEDITLSGIDNNNSEDGIINYVQKAINKIFSEKLYPLIVESMEPHPYMALISMVNHGHVLLSVVSYIAIIAAGVWVATTVSETAAGFASKVPLIGSSLGKLGDLAAGVGKLIVAVLKLTGFVLLAVAMVHAYILPMMPYIYMLFFVVGLLILVTEALIAAPIWALMHVRLDGQEFADQVQKPGYMIVFNLILRPSLAVLGLIISMTVFSASIYFLNETFDIAAQATMPSDTGFALLGVLSMLLIQTYLHYQLAVRSFSLIVSAPDRVTRWFGQAGENLNEAQDTDRAVGLFVSNSEGRMNEAAGAIGTKRAAPNMDPSPDDGKKDPKEKEKEKD